MLRATPLINQVFTATAATSSSPPVRVAGCPLSAAGVRGSVAPPGPGVSSCHRPLGRGGGVPAPRSRRRPPCDAGGGGGAAARAFAWAEGKAASPVCFIFSWQLRAAQLRSAGGAGGAAGEGGPTERASEPADGAPAERGYRRQAGRRAGCSQPGCRAPPPPPAPAPAAEGEAGSGLRRPPAAAAAPLGLAARCPAAPPPAPPPQPRRAGALQMASPGLELGGVQPPPDPPQPELAFTEAQKWIEVRPRDGRGAGA